MKIIDSNFDNSVINGMAAQFGLFLGILVIAITALIIFFKILKVPNKIAGSLAILIFLVIAYYVYQICNILPS